MTINFLEPQLKISGGRRIIFGLADSLAKMGHDVIITTINTNFLRRMVLNLLKIRPNWTRSYNLNIKRVPSYEEKYMTPADVIVATSWQAVSAMDLLPPRFGKKFNFVQHDERLYHGKIENVDLAYRCKNVKIVCADWIKDMFLRDYGVEAKVLTNFMDKKLFHKINREKDEREIRVLLLDHTYEWKGTREGVEVVQDLKKKYKNLKLILFGTRKKNSGYPCDEYYYNLPQEKLAWLYSNSDIFLCPSWDEGYSLLSTEAMACGAALVAYGTGSARHYAFDGETAMVAERKNVESLKEKLEVLVRDSNLRRKIAQGGYEFAQKMPTSYEQAKKMEKFFTEELNKNI